MTEPESPKTESTSESSTGEAAPREVAEEIRLLGQNLVNALKSAWESDERRKLQSEIQVALSDLGVTINEASTEFREGATGQRLREDVQDFRQRVRSGELEGQIRDELLNTLRVVNAELGKASRKQNPEDKQDPEE